MSRKKTHVLLQEGPECIVLKTKDIALFYTDNRILYAVDRHGKKHVVNKSLSQLRLELDRRMFFCTNSKNIININYVRSFRTFNKVNLAVKIFLKTRFSIIINKEEVPFFKKWITEY